MANTRVLLDLIDKFDEQYKGLAYDLRLDLADIVTIALSEKKLTQSQLAELAGMKPAMLTRIIHSQTNFTAETAAKLLFALGMKAKLVATPKDANEASPPKMMGPSTSDMCRVRRQIFGNSN